MICGEILTHRDGKRYVCLSKKGAKYDHSVPCFYLYNRPEFVWNKPFRPLDKDEATEWRHGTEYAVIPTRYHPPDTKWMARMDQRAMTAKEITVASDTWFMFKGFEGAQCSNCCATLNVLSCGPGYFCPRCGYFNNQCFSGGPMPLKRPMYGPTQRVIRRGLRRAKSYREYRCKTSGRHWRLWDFCNDVTLAISKPYRLSRLLTFDWGMIQ